MIPITIAVNGKELEAMMFDGDFLVRASVPGEFLWVVTRSGQLVDDTLWSRSDMESSEYFAKWLGPAFDHFWPEGR